MKIIKKLTAVSLALTMMLSQTAFAKEEDEYSKVETILNYAANLYIDDSVDADDILDQALQVVLRDNPELATKIIKAGLSSLDEYTEYYTAEEYELFQRNLNHIVYGIGVMIQEKDGYVTVMTVLEDGSAKKAGVMPGDKIVKVEGADVVGESLDKVQDLVVGEKGSSVTVTFLRGNKEYTCTMTRGEVKGNTVSSLILKNNIGYMDILNFAADTADEVRDSLEFFDENNVKKIIIDLRDNPGGYLNSAVDIAKMFVPKGVIVSTVYRSEWENETFYSELPKTKYELAVLVNENTASASEVLSSAIQDSKAGILIGDKTYGKGVVQEMYNIWDGCAFKITTGRYFTRNGKDINGGGIEPDEYVDNSTKRIDLTKYETFDYKNKPSLGDNSKNVKAAKERLSKLGYYYGEINDIFDESLYDAVYNFQAENELFPYGVLDVSTQAQMENKFYKLEETVDDQLIFAYEYFGGVKEDLFEAE